MVSSFVLSPWFLWLFANSDCPSLLLQTWLFFQQDSIKAIYNLQKVIAIFFWSFKLFWSSFLDIILTNVTIILTKGFCTDFVNK